MRIRKISALLLSVGLLMGITACKGGISETGSKAEASDSIRDSVVIAIGSEPETLDPTKGWGHGNSPIVQSKIGRAHV